METLLNDCNKKILSLSEERSQTIKEAEKEKNTLTEKLERLQRSTSSQDSDKEQLTTKYEHLVVKYEQMAEKHEKTATDYKEQLVRANKVVEEH